MIYEQKHLVAYVPHSNDLQCTQWADTESYQPTPDYFHLYDHPDDQNHNEQKCHHALNQTCQDIFEEWERKVELAKKLRKKSARNAAGSARVKSDQAKPAREAKGKRQKAPNEKLPQIGMEYLNSLRVELSPIIYSGSPNQPTGWAWDFQYPHIERGLLHLLFVDKHYQTVTEAIRRIFQSEKRICNWSLSWNNEFNSIWNESCYYLSPSGRKREEMTPVITFRNRVRNPSPLEASYGKFKYNIPEQAKEFLELFLANSATGRPSKEEREMLRDKTGLNLETVTNWFKNKRQREAKNSSRSSSSSGCSNISQSSSLETIVGQSSSLESTGSLSPPTVAMDIFESYDEIYMGSLSLGWCEDPLLPNFAH